MFETMRAVTIVDVVNVDGPGKPRDGFARSSGDGLNHTISDAFAVMVLTCLAAQKQCLSVSCCDLPIVCLLNCMPLACLAAWTRV